jgi:glycosyltransferase involved in cell wall biosynthesis
MVTTGARLPLAEHAIECYRRQTWPRRELVVLDGSRDDRLERHLTGIDDPSIRLVRAPSDAFTLGELRNRSVAEARGSFICQWDDDDLSDPARIEVQMGTLARTKSQACFLTQLTIWWPHLERLAITRRIWEASLICRKDIVGRYPSMPRGEDSIVMRQIAGKHDVAYLDRPDLYIYVFHGANTWDAGHFNDFWNGRSAEFIGRNASAALSELGSRVPIAAYRNALRAMPAPAGEPAG